MYLFQTMILMIQTMALSVAAVSVSDSVNSDFDEKSLFAMGTSLNNSLLKLLGRRFERLENYILKDIERLENDVLKDINNKTTFVLGQVNTDKSSLEQRLVSERKELIDIICQLHPCTEWETWTGCSAKLKGTFGAQTRYRTCDVKASKLCSSVGQEQKETDSRICEGTQCPTNYTATTNGYCIDVHKVSLNWTNAQAVCKKEGGYLINIDSELKALDVNNTLKQMSLTTYFWIDGTRTLPGGKWRYEYGPRDPAYSNWYSGHPVASHDCRAYLFSSSVWYWYGQLCTYARYFICELV